MNAIAIIPARGGSVRLPCKNVLPVGGIPLVVRAIQAAQGVERIARIIVSTDDDEVGRISRQAGAEVLPRPDSLSHGDLAGPHVLLAHVIDRLEKYWSGTLRVGVIVLLQPTSPLRTVKDIDEALDLYQSGDCDSVTSVCGGTENGAVYVTHATLVRSGSIYGSHLKQYEMPPERSIDIDTQEDLEWAEQTLQSSKIAIKLNIQPAHRSRKGWPKGKKRGSK